MSADTEAAPSPESPQAPDERTRHEARNLAILATQNVILRIGWIFKTESVIMPAFIDAISNAANGAGWQRGMLPILSRIGQSVPPLIYADRLRARPYKKSALILTALQMAWPFLLLSAVLFWLQNPETGMIRRQSWLPWLFLLLYFLFFSATGLNQLAFGVLQGKLIRPHRRGRLLGIGGVLGSIGAVTAALLWLRPWIDLPGITGYRLIFLFNGLTFLLAGTVPLLCRETPDPAIPRERKRVSRPFQDAWRIFRDDRSFRRAARVAMLFISSILLFPHYQWIGQQLMDLPKAELITWVIAQNISVGLLSPALGAVADRFGNRLAIRMAVFTAAVTPLLATGFGKGWLPISAGNYWMVFAFLGLTPVTMKTILNYTLELSDPDSHAKYQSAMAFCFAVPFIFSPFVGWTVEQFPFEYAFYGVSGLIAVGGILTFRMIEPRQTVKPPGTETS